MKANCMLYYVGFCGYTTHKPSVWHSMLPRCHLSQELKERYVVSVINGTGEHAGCYSISVTLFPASRGAFSIQIIHTSPISVSVSPLCFTYFFLCHFRSNQQKALPAALDLSASSAE